MEEKKLKIQNLSLHWFRRDLRIASNPALRWSCKKYQGRVLGIFCFDSKFLSRPDFSNNRFSFFLESLKELKSEMKALGGDLLVLDDAPQEAFHKIIDFFKNHSNYNLETITFNRDYEPFARQRDEKMESLFKNLGLEVKTFRDHLIIEPWELYKDRDFPATSQGTPYKVFTPFSKRWFIHFKTISIQSQINDQKNGFDYLRRISQNSLQGLQNHQSLFKVQWSLFSSSNFNLHDALDRFIENNNLSVNIPIPRAGSLEAFNALKKFCIKIKTYHVDRDIPSINGTSRLSIYLKNGSLTTSQILYFIQSEFPEIYTTEGGHRFITELVWREFYYHILYHFPHVESSEFNEKYRNLSWQNNPHFFECWCRGQTGFPIVDAGMRELNTTGWMHNRVRMIVASFLVKDLLIDWRWGENYFMKKLLDGDLAPNNGGWQWAASTGCDAQPYFRIFNPWLQSQKFDPDGVYIRKYIPELKNVPSTFLHNPSQENYPLPIVDHQVQKLKAIELFQKGKM